MQMPQQWTEAEVPEGGTLLRKEIYEYHNEKGEYVIELFEKIDGQCYAIGVPKEDERLIIFGSNITATRAMALSIVIDKIEREG
jgi:hypothetical protein